MRNRSIIRLSQSAWIWILVVAAIPKHLLAADFVVATRDDVLRLTSQIQATQFLTHATFGATQAEIDALATDMRSMGTLAAANQWITNQLSATPSLQSPLEKSMCESDYPFWSLYFRTGIAPNYVYTASNATIDTTNAMTRAGYRTRAWWHNAIAGSDQLRQKTAWALSQIFSVSNAGVNFNEEELESTVAGGPTPNAVAFKA